MSEGDFIDLGIDGIEEAVPIGSGGAAMVYRARQPRLNRTVAVKVIQAVGDEATARRFAREAKALGQLSEHPGIVTVYDVGRTPSGQPYLIMQYCEAGSLQDRLHDTGPVEVAETVTITTSLADALDHAHGQGIMHRDLKPANVLISNSGRFLVADFGIAALADTSAIVSTAVSFTPGYAPPETIQGDAATPASDVYSLGATMYALVTGRHPFAEDGESNIYTLINRILNEQLDDTRAQGVPDAVASIIEECTSKTPGERPTMAELGGRLRTLDPAAVATESAPPTFVAPEPVTAEPETDPAAPADPDRRARPQGGRWWWLVGAAAAVAAAVAAVVVLSGGESDSPSPPAAVVDTTGVSSTATAVGTTPPEPQVVDTIDIGGDPQDPLVLNGQIWISNRADATVSVVDGPSASVVATIDVGAGPLRPAAIGGRVWVASDGDDSVSVISPGDPSTEAEVATGDRPRTPAPIGDQVWITNRESVTVVAPDSLEVTGTFALEGRPRTPLEVDGLAWVPNRNAGTVSVFDAASGTLVEEVTVGAGPLPPVLIDGRLWVANEDDVSVTIIDLDNRQVVGTVTVGTMPREPVLAQGLVWAASAVDGTVTVIDPGSLDVVDVVTAGSSTGRPAVLDGRLWVPNPSEGTVTPIDLSSRSVGAPVTVGALPVQPAVVGERLFVANGGDGTVSVIEVN